MLLNFQKLIANPNIETLFDLNNDLLLYTKINSCRVAIVDEFYPETMEVKVRIANKMITGTNADGSQIMQDYAPIIAKAYFVGSNDIGINYPIEKNSEGILLFNDRELESWYINGDINPLSYNRCHDLTDGIFLCGLHSQPNLNLVKYIENCLNIYYKNSSIQIKDGTITINGNTTINGNLVVNGKINATGDIVAGGISLLNHIHGNGNQGADTTKPK